jgi:branched-chain amino acid transport system ATP-binding protein
MTAWHCGTDRSGHDGASGVASQADTAVTLLELDAVDTCYAASQVLFGMRLTIRPGEVVTLLGRNGMGKSTTVKSIMGIVPPVRGAIRFRGDRIDRDPPDRIARRGIALVPEGRQIFPNLSVRENLVAFAAKRASSARPWTLASVFELFPRLKERCDHMGNHLSGGEQQMLAIGRALMTNPHLVILDEATEGLAPLIRSEIWRCLASLKASGLAILVIDKYVRALIDVADRHYIIERGSVAWSGNSDALACQPQLWHRYLGISG